MFDKCKKKKNNEPEGPKPVSMFKLLSFANRWVEKKKYMISFLITQKIKQKK